MARSFSLSGLIAAALTVWVSSALADEGADFYRGKTINFVVGSAAGGNYDIYSRLTANAMARQLPESPKVIIRNMPGASSRTAASHVYNIASKDGLTLAMVNQELTLAQALGEKFQFDMAKFNWIGSPDFDNRVVLTWHTSGVKTLEDAKKKVVMMGESGPVNTTGYPEMVNTLIGTKFKTITGYESGPAIRLAMERGELDGRAATAWETWKAEYGDAQRGQSYVLVQVGLAKVADLPDVPLLMDLASTPESREALKLLSSSTLFGHPIVVAPGVPDERVKALRAAFDSAMTDRATLADAEKAGIKLRAVPGARLQEVASQVLGTSQDVRDRASAFLPVRNSQK